MSQAPEQAPDAPRLPDEVMERAESAEPAGPISRRKLIFGGIFTLAALGGLYFLIPKLAGFRRTWGQLKHGDPVLLAIAMVLELLSLAGYSWLFGTVFGRGHKRINWRVSLEIP